MAKDTQQTTTPLTVSPEAIEAIKTLRLAAQKEFGLRPDFSLVASALLIEAAQNPDAINVIRNYAMKIFGLPTPVEAKPA